MPIISRRTVLGASVVVVAGAAGAAAEVLRHPHRSGPSTGAKGSDAPTTTPATPTAPALQDALSREQTLLARLARAASAAPSLTVAIGILRADHRAHADALADLIVAAGATPTPTSPTPTAPASARPPTVAELVRWEKAAAASFAADFDAATGAAAAVLASIYACEQTHVAWLA